VRITRWRSLAPLGAKDGLSRLGVGSWHKSVRITRVRQFLESEELPPRGGVKGFLKIIKKIGASEARQA